MLGFLGFIPGNSYRPSLPIFIEQRHGARATLGFNHEARHYDYKYRAAHQTSRTARRACRKSYRKMREYMALRIERSDRCRIGAIDISARDEQRAALFVVFRQSKQMIRFWPNISAARV